MAKFTFEEVARMTEEEWNELCDFGCFNEAISGYLILAMQDAEIDREEIRKALGSLRVIFDETTAAEARAAWRKF